MSVNHTTVIIAALAYYFSGAIWYSQAFLGVPWMSAVGLSEKKRTRQKKSAWKSYLVSLVCALIISYGIARIEMYMQVSSFTGGIYTGFWTWLCFVFTTAATNNFFAGRPFKLLLIDTGYHLYGFLLMGVILAVWK